MMKNILKKGKSKSHLSVSSLRDVWALLTMDSNFLTSSKAVTIRTKTLVFTLVFTLLISLFGNVNPALAADASLYLSPGSGTYVIGGTFNVGIKVNTGGQVVNAAEGTISYDTKLLDVASISKNGSIFTLWTTEPTHGSGNISFGGGIPRPGYNGTAGHVATITFRAKAVGDASVRFTGGAVLANDGKGTNILGSMGAGSYKISPKVDAPPVTSGNTAPSTPAGPAEPAYNLPVITSETHPDANSWYNERKAIFKWELPTDAVGVSVLLDENPISDPGPVPDGLFDTKEFNDLEDGIHYLHVKFKDSRKWGTIAHYRIMIDTNPPQPFEARVEVRESGFWPIIKFETEDGESGLLKYEVYIGSLEKQAHEVGIDIKMLEVSELNVGKHTAIIKAVDNAGNERIATVEFVIDPIEAPLISNYSATLKSSDKFYINGTAVPKATVRVFIKTEDGRVSSSTVKADLSGDWFYLHALGLENGRYLAWVQAVNEIGITSDFSSQVTFLVSPPIFASIGNFVVNYFTVIVSLIFLIILIVVLIIYLARLIRRKLRRETLEVENVLRKNMGQLKSDFDAEFDRLQKFEGKVAYKKEKAKTQAALQKRISDLEDQILKEVKDVEDILE